jgi:polyphosphate kinase 2 (PPK2 family)
MPDTPDVPTTEQPPPSKADIKIPKSLIPKDIRKKIEKTPKGKLINGDYPYSDKLKRGEYEEEKERLQVELLKMQHWVKESGQRVVLLFEGRDAAGKGGAINRALKMRA